MEVGWHLRFTRENALTILVGAALAPNVEDAVFIADGWNLAWDRAAESQGFITARLTRKGREEG
ncbi:MAG: hypothetical protein AUJ49_04110 [Desulfovibrionaceae bacterium CG1_02_65_16]|nr:MAG: hypothetical protein AUJ49_04110 [Desulfovibrionaceae bacterium CG1_02_65_16]